MYHVYFKARTYIWSNVSKLQTMHFSFVHRPPGPSLRALSVIMDTFRNLNGMLGFGLFVALRPGCCESGCRSVRKTRQR